MLTLSTVLAQVFPAYAGMSPRLRTVPPLRQRFPRLRGDEPFSARGLSNFSEFSPLTRG